jgi:hypothetical protein
MKKTSQYRPASPRHPLKVRRTIHLPHRLLPRPPFSTARAKVHAQKSTPSFPYRQQSNLKPHLVCSVLNLLRGYLFGCGIAAPCSFVASARITGNPDHPRFIAFFPAF